MSPSEVLKASHSSHKLLKGCFLYTLNRYAGLSFKIDTFLSAEKKNMIKKRRRNAVSHPQDGVMWEHSRRLARVCTASGRE